MTSRSSPGFSAILPRLHALRVAHLQLRHLDHCVATRLFITWDSQPFSLPNRRQSRVLHLEAAAGTGGSHIARIPTLPKAELPILHKHNLLVVRPTCSFDIIHFCLYGVVARRAESKSSQLCTVQQDEPPALAATGRRKTKLTQGTAGINPKKETATNAPRGRILFLMQNAHCEGTQTETKNLQKEPETQRPKRKKIRW